MGDSPSALVTGAASGIGRALATLLSGQGYELHLVDIDRPRLDDLAADIGASAVHDVSVADVGAVDELARTVGAVDLLCLNAGVLSSTMGTPWLASAEEWDRVFGVNVFGVVNGLRSFVPPMLERGTESRILITASLAGVASWPGGGPYGASKHAALAIAEQAALELAESNVSVTVLCPALVRSGMSEAGEDPLDVAADALAAAEGGRFAVIPADWASAVRTRGDHLTSGGQPEVPRPSSS